MNAEDEIRRLTAQFVRSFNAGDLRGMMDLYANDYVDVNLRYPLQTKAERSKYYQAILDRRDTKIEVELDEVIVVGEYAFARGTISLFRPKSAPEPKQLRYIEVWRRFPEGWRSIWGIDADIHD